MKKNFVKGLALGMTTMMMLGAFVGCGSSSDSADSAAADSVAGSAEAGETADLSGSLSLAGSTSMEKLCEALRESFMAKYPDVTVTCEYTGSGAGLESLAAGTIDIGNASRHLEDGEIQNGAVENVVAIDGIAVIVDKDNQIGNLSAENLAAIYTGEITNWSELGGDDESIVVLGREAGSGTRDAFEELLNVANACAYAQEIDSTGGVLAKVAATPGAIGYVSLDVVDDSVNEVSLDGVEATEENILAGDYLLSRPFVMATTGEISEQNELVQAWFDYIASEEGQTIISGVGLILPE